MPNKDEFREELHARFKRAMERGATEIEINSGELHRALGGYPAQKHQMPTCCDAMQEEVRAGDRVVSSPPRGRGASLTIRYELPRR
jgi:hypothetical protein